MKTVAALILSAVASFGQLVRIPEPIRLNAAGQKLILDFEVGGGERYYQRYLARPTWPGFVSGVTWGVGYDTGYNSKAVIRQDWEGLQDVERMAATSGLTGQAAKARVASVRDILISWEHALGVFNAVTVTRFYVLTQRTFPGFDELNDNAQAALVSLVFNRGSSMAGPRREEMRAIRSLVPKRDYAGIAREIRRMKHLWRGTQIENGMTTRREAEAKLVEQPSSNP